MKFFDIKIKLTGIMPRAVRREIGLKVVHASLKDLGTEFAS